MDFDRENYARRNSLRLKGFDYSWPRIYFVTINAFNRHPFFDDSRVAEATIECLKQLRKKFGFTVYIFCLMPDHLHAIIGPGVSQRSLGGICGAFKSLSTREFWQWHDGKLWQRQYYDHIIRNCEDFDETVNYIRLNPVRRRLVERPEDWPYTERLDYLHLVAKAMTARAGTSPAPTE
jgi:REP element-mobilizing transposase RayT